MQLWLDAGDPMPQDGQPSVGIRYAFSIAPDTMVFGKPRRQTDGQLGAQHWPAKCVGRVVGVISPTWERY